MQFSLRNGLIVVGVICCLAAAQNHRERQKRKRYDALVYLEQSGGLVYATPDRETLDDHYAVLPSSPAGCRRQNVLIRPAFEVAAIDLSHLTLTSGMLRAIAVLDEVRTLRLSRSSATNHDLTELSGLRQLSRLDLDGTEIDDRSPESLGQFRNLASLSLADTRAGDRALATIASLGALETLNLDGTGITETGIRQLARLKSLSFVRLYRTAASPGAVAELDQALPLAEMCHPAVLAEAQATGGIDSSANIRPSSSSRLTTGTTTGSMPIRSSSLVAFPGSRNQ